MQRAAEPAARAHHRKRTYSHHAHTHVCMPISMVARPYGNRAESTCARVCSHGLTLSSWHTGDARGYECKTHMTSPHMVACTLHICTHHKRTQAPARVAAHTRPRVHLRARADLSISEGHICAYVYTYAYTYMHTYVYIYIYICARASARPGAIHTHTHALTRVHAQTRTDTHRQPSHPCRA
jgi:hypothetical protein